MSGKRPTTKGKPTVTSKSVSAKLTNDDHHGERGSKSTFKSVRSYDLYPPKNLDLGTVYQAVEERKIVSALSVMPVEFHKTLYYHGWMLKTNVPNSKYSNKTLGSLHPNVNLVRTLAEKHKAGLIWTNDVLSSKVQWLKLNPWVVVNRFPRNGYPEIKLCGYGMVGKAEYDDYHPRTYPNTTVNSGFLEDYALTACVSLLRAFDDKNVKCKESGKVPLSALHFAVEKCSAYMTDGKLMDFVTGDDEGVTAEWQTFFDHYRKIVNGKHNFTGPRTGAEELRCLEQTAGRLVKELSVSRPQTARIDGYKNIWILKNRRSAATDESFLFDDVAVALKHCPKLNGGGADHDYVVQKYIETPLLNGAHKFMVHAWLVISTLDRRLSVWLYQTCSTQTSVFEFSLHVNGHSRYSPNAHLMQRLDRMHSTTRTVGLKSLKNKFKTMMIGPYGGGADKTAAVSSRIKSSIVSAVMAATNAADTVLHLRPNCFELFQATFVVADNLQPWLINIRSDPTPTHSMKFSMQHTMGDIAKNMAKMIVCKNRVSTAKIGKFELLHVSSIPGEAYEPRAFAVTTVPKKSKRDNHRNDYIEGFPSEHSDDRSVESLGDDSEDCLKDDFKDGQIESKPPKRMFDGPKINLEMSKNYLRALDQMKSSLDIIRKYCIKGHLHS